MTPLLPTTTPIAICADCFEVLPQLPDQSIDMILCDLPYHMTCNTWDVQIPLEDYVVIGERLVTFSELNDALWRPNIRTRLITNAVWATLLDRPMREIVAFWNKNKRPGLWTHYNRIIKPHGAIILFGAGMFTSELMRSGKVPWRYNIIWYKNLPTGFLNANRMPLRAHEDILVFYKHLPVYHPQKSSGHEPVHTYVKHSSDGSNYGATKLEISGGGSTERFPTTIWRFGSDTQKSALHTTQKPLALCEELIKTYSDEGMLILDNCAGSFTTAVACDNLKRNWIAIEKEPSIFDLGLSRVNENRALLGLPAVDSLFERETLI